MIRDMRLFSIVAPAVFSCAELGGKLTWMELRCESQKLFFFEDNKKPCVAVAFLGTFALVVTLVVVRGERHLPSSRSLTLLSAFVQLPKLFFSHDGSFWILSMTPNTYINLLLADYTFFISKVYISWPFCDSFWFKKGEMLPLAAKSSDHQFYH